MASLKNLIQKSTVEAVETNLERGKIFTFTTAGAVGNIFFSNGCFCWNAPAAGVVVIEAWGAAGSSAQMGCCGYGIPGNPGAYGKKTITVASGCWIYGCPGISCGNPGTACFRGCSNPTGVCWSSTTGTGCMCVQGGRGGTSYCHTSTTSIYCCFVQGGFCSTAVGTGCGFVCNAASGSFIPTSSGGDINCSGGISCVYFGNCNSCCWPNICNYVRTSANIFSEQGSTASFSQDANRMSVAGSGYGYNPMSRAIAALDRTPSVSPMAYCWANTTACACYNAYGCFPFFGVGIPGGPAIPSSNIIDFGMRGAHGVVRLQFIPS